MDDYGDDRDESKRKSRNQSEKKRRDQFNVLVSELSSMVTGVQASEDVGGQTSGSSAAAAAAAAAQRKMDKTTVLLATIDFLKKHNEAAKNPAGTNSEQNTHSAKTAASEWKPSFLSDEEFLHLMLESVDGFVLIVNMCDNGRIMYASEGITWLLGHVPNTLVDRNVSIYDIMADEDINNFKAALNDKISEADEVNKSNVEAYVHIEKGGAHQELDEDKNNHALVRFSGYVARWARNSSKRLGEPNCDEHCLPPSDDESVSSKSNGASSIQSKRNPEQSSEAGGMTQNVFICTARLMSPQLLREMPVMHDAKGEFTSRYSLEWKFLYLDNRAPPIIGYLSFEVLGTSGYDYYHPDDLDKIVQCHQALMQTGEATSCYHRFLTKGQQWIWLQARYFITYHQWNSKPEFIFATHSTISYNEVLSQLKGKKPGQNNSNNHNNTHNLSIDIDVKSDQGSNYSVAPSQTSPTWSSRSSFCGSTGTGITSRKSQSSCGLSGYSDQVNNTGMHSNSSQHMGHSSGRHASGGHAQGGQSHGGHTHRHGHGHSRRTGEPSGNNELSYDTFNNSTDMEMSQTGDMSQTGNSVYSMNNLDTGGQGLESGIGGHSNRPGDILHQQAPNMEFGGQPVRQPMVMTDLQLQMHRQLKAKHAELFKKIVEQQEELRKVSEQLLMTEYGNMAILPVAVAPGIPVSVAQIVQGGRGTAVAVVTQPLHGTSGSALSLPVRGNGHPDLFGPAEMQLGYDNVLSASTPSQNNTPRNRGIPHNR